MGLVGPDGGLEFEDEVGVVGEDVVAEGSQLFEIVAALLG